MHRFSILALAALALVGCQEQRSQPLIFGQGLSFGVVVGAAPQAGNTPELSVGLKMVDIAIVPTVIGLSEEVVRQAVADSSKWSALLQADRKIQGNRGVDLDIQSGGAGNRSYESQDALSTFGSFSSTTESDKVKLGVFFATGVAAQSLAEGFKCGVGPRHKDCTSADGAPADQGSDG